MKIITYNIHHCTQEKVDSVLRRRADVYVLPEMADPSTLSLPDGYTSYWQGDIAIKGLGVIVRPGLRSRVPDWFDSSLKYFIPVICERILVLASWPTRRESNAPKGYPQIAVEAMRSYGTRFDAFPSVVTGDLNLYKGQQDETEEYSLEAVAGYLKRYGMRSAYHLMTGEPFGQERQATYYHRFEKDKPFFLDYTFTNIPVKDYVLYGWDPQFSDHVMQMLEV